MCIHTMLTGEVDPELTALSTTSTRKLFHFSQAPNSVLILLSPSTFIIKSNHLELRPLAFYIKGLSILSHRERQIFVVYMGFSCCLKT